MVAMIVTAVSIVNHRLSSPPDYTHSNQPVSLSKFKHAIKLLENKNTFKVPKSPLVAVKNERDASPAAKNISISLFDF